MLSTVERDGDGVSPQNRPKISGILTIFIVLGVLAGAGVAVAQGPIVGPGTTFEAGDAGPTVTITEELELEDPFFYPDNRTVDLSPHATFSSDGDTNVTVEQISGSFTRLATHDIAPALTVNASDKQEVTMAGASVHQVNFSSVDVSSTAVELEYRSSEPLEYTLTDLPSGTDVQAIHTSSGDVLATETTDGNGVATYMLPAGDGMTVTFVTKEEPEPEPEPVPHRSPHFEVSILETNSPVQPGDTVSVNVVVENTGNGSSEEDLVFDLGPVSETEPLLLAPGDSVVRTFEWQTSSDDVGSYTATATTPSDADNASVEVTAGGPVFQNGVIANESADTINATFDQNVFLNNGLDGMTVLVEGESVGIDSASTDGRDLNVVLDEPVEANQDVEFVYSGNSDNIVNQFDVESDAFTFDIDNQVYDPFVANLSAIDPTTGNFTSEITVDISADDGVVFTAQFSEFPEDSDVTYRWYVGNDSFVTDEPELSEQFLEPGTYEANVTVLDGDRSSADSFTLTVIDATAPHVDLSADDPVGVGEDPRLDGSLSEDNVEIAEYEWEFGDGGTASGANLTQPDHAYDEPGTYEVNLTVTDTSGNVAWNQTTVQVEPSGDGSLLDTQWLLLLLLLALLLIFVYFYMRRRQEEEE